MAKTNIKEEKGKIDFHDQISRNKIKSIVLIIFVFIVFFLLGYVISKAFALDVFMILAFASILSIIYVSITYNFSDKIALASVSAYKADKIEHEKLYNAVENMSIASGMPMPRVFVMPGEQINAFATGKNPQKSVICVTEGALKNLNKQELEGVIGHEMSHIANYDIRFVTIVAVVVGAIAIFSQVFLRSLAFRDSGGDNKNPIFFILAIILAILAPIIVKLVQLAISRKREYVADAGAVQFTRYPPGLISALKKIQNDHEELKVSGAVSPMFFSDTSKSRFLELFQTHPRVSARLDALERM